MNKTRSQVYRKWIAFSIIIGLALSQVASGDEGSMAPAKPSEKIPLQNLTPKKTQESDASDVNPNLKTWTHKQKFEEQKPVNPQGDLNQKPDYSVPDRHWKGNPDSSPFSTHSVMKQQWEGKSPNPFIKK